VVMQRPVLWNSLDGLFQPGEQLRIYHRTSPIKPGWGRTATA
jgi:hypothetical protein